MPRYRRRSSSRHPLRVQLLEPRLLLAEDAFEPNDSTSDVDPAGAAANFGLLNDTLVQTGLALEDPNDFFRFETSETGTTHDFAQIEFDNSEGNLNLELLDASGSRIDSATSGSTDLERVSLAGEPAGVYYVRILGGGGAANSNYVLTIDPPGNSVDDFYEPNDSRTVVETQPAAATSSPNLGVLGEPIQISNLRLEDSADLFRFETTATGTSEHFARIEFDNDLGNLNFELFDFLGNRLDSSTSGSADDAQVSLATEPAGVYFVRVFGGFGAANPEYALTIVPPPNAVPNAPEILVEVNGAEIVSGQHDAVSFGQIGITEAGPEISFEVTNNGQTALSTENLLVPPGFTIVDPLNASIAVGQSDSFRIRLDSDASGTRFGEVRFATNDVDESEFRFPILGIVTPTTDTEGGDVFEENDDRFTVLAKTPGVPDSANLGVLSETLVLARQNLSDDDWFRFETIDRGTQADTIQIDFDNGDGNLNLQLYDVRGNRIAAATSGSSDIERVNLANRPAGTYFVRVFGAGGAVNPEYALTINPPGNSADDFYEPNEDRFQVDLQPVAGVSSPNLGELGEPIQINNLRLADEADWFRFETTATGTTRHIVRIEFDNTFGDLNLQLYDAFGRRLDSSTSGSSDNAQVSLATEPPGTYYARVFGGGGDVNSNYALTIIPPSSATPAGAEITVQTGQANVVSGQDDPVSLGEVMQGAIGREVAFDVFNSGVSTLLTDNLTIPEGFELLDPLASSIAPGQVDSIRLRLRSDQPGSRYGEVRFSTNDRDESEFKFPVVGTVLPTVSDVNSDIFEDNDDRFEVSAKAAGLANSANIGVLLQPLVLTGLSINDDDWFRFETTEVGTRHDFVRIDFDNGGGDLNLQLFDSRGNRIDASTSGSSDSERVELARRGRGVYFARVYGQSGATNPNYSITFDPPGNSQDDLLEPNEDRFQVDLQVPGAIDSPNFGVLNTTLVRPNLRLEDNADWFRFETTATGTTQHLVRIDFENGDGDLNLELYDSLGNRIDASTSGSSDDEEVSLATEPAGVYYARVLGGSGAANADYTLTVIPPGAPGEITLNVTPNSFDEAAGASAAMGTVTRSSGTSGDLTVFLASSDFSEARVPFSVLIPDGEAASVFPIAAIDDSDPDGSQTVQLTAWADQHVSGATTITVTDSGDINTRPTISDISDVTVDGGATAGPLDFTISDVDTDAGLLQLEVDSTNRSLFPISSITFGGSGTDRTITLVPENNQVGESTITVTVTDPGGLTQSDQFVVTVEPANARPSFSASDPAPVLEDAGAQTVNGFATFDPGAADESGQAVLGYTVTNVSNPTLFATLPAIDNSGNLTYETAEHAFGSSTFDVTVQDDGGTAGGSNDTSEVQTFNLVVTGVNDPPTFTLLGVININEDAPQQTVTNYARNFDPGPNEETGTMPQSIANYSVRNVSDTGLFAEAPQIDNEGTLTYTPAPDANGSATFEVLVQDTGSTDNGGQNTSTAVVGTIMISPTNDAPSFTANDPPVVLENAGPQSVALVTGFDPGPADESDQTVLEYDVDNVSFPGLFSAGPAVDAAGNLTYTSSADTFGTSTFEVTVRDSGGVLGGGNDTSVPQTFTITVKPQLVVQWDNPEPIIVGTVLSDAQLNATANISGRFEYSPADGFLLDQGNDQNLTVTFRPDDPFYAPVVSTVTIDVLPVPPDFGDAPARYPVTLADNGARHNVGSLRLGATVDTEADGQPTDSADGDGSDDDGVLVLANSVAVSGVATRASFLLQASDTGLLDAWIDFNGDGDWDDAGERIATGFALSAGENLVSYTTPANAVPGTTAARFRISTAGVSAPTGLAVDGEVEDYLVTILDGSQPVDVDAQLSDDEATIINLNGDLQIISLGQTFFSLPLGSLNTFGLSGSQLDDILTLDFSGGTILSQGGLDLNGSGGVNLLRLVGADAEVDLTSVNAFFLRNFVEIDLSSPSVFNLVINAVSVNTLSPGSGRILVVGSELDTLSFTDLDDWRMGPTTVTGGKFLRSATNLRGSEVVDLDFLRPWQNVVRASDVNNNGDVTSGDALRIINELSRREFSDAETGELINPVEFVQTREWPQVYCDQNGDDHVTALDALRVINELARILLREGEPELPLIDLAIRDLTGADEESLVGDRGPGLVEPVSRDGRITAAAVVPTSTPDRDSDEPVARSGSENQEGEPNDLLDPPPSRNGLRTFS